MDKKLKKQLIWAGVIIFILSLPLILLSNPALEKVHAWNKKKHKKFMKKLEKGKEVDKKKWENLKYRQQLIGDLYYYTFREQMAIKAYENYLNWFREDFWDTQEFIQIKYSTGIMCREVAQENSSKRVEFYRKSGCHLKEITDWYENRPQFEKTLKKARNALVNFDLKEKARECRSSPRSVW